MSYEHSRGVAKLICLVTIAVLVAVSGVVLAQEQAAAEQESQKPPCEQKKEDVPIRTVLQPIAYLNVTELEDVFQLLDVESVIKPSINAVLLRGEIDKVEGALKALRVMDQPNMAMDVTMFVVRAAKEKSAGGEIPDDLKPAIDQLMGVFGYRSFTLLETMSLRTVNNGGGLVGGTLDLGDAADSYNANCEVSFRSARVIPEDGYTVVRLDNLRFEANNRPSLQTDIEIREGQKAILGRSSMLGVDFVLIIEVKTRPVQEG